VKISELWSACAAASDYSEIMNLVLKANNQEAEKKPGKIKVCIGEPLLHGYHIYNSYIDRDLVLRMLKHAAARAKVALDQFGVVEDADPSDSRAPEVGK
jgi:hypothetical protein